MRHGKLNHAGCERRWPATIALIVGGLLAAASCDAGPVGSVFTYQGKLTDGGEPANGIYDFHVHLYDSASGGAVVGNPLGQVFNDIQVIDGAFTIPLDFGADAFTGDARYLNIQVRPGASGGFYTALSPRQPLNPAPYALHALNSAWEKDGTAIRNTNTGFVGVNRSVPVGSAEAFGVQSPATGTSYGGMYVATDGPSARPFYGYTTGTNTAWSYLDGASGAWHLYNAGSRMTITKDGDVGIGSTSPAARLHAVSNNDKSIARFDNTNSANSSSAVLVNTNGGGSGVWSKTTGTGSAGRFEISNSASTSPALDVRTTGLGPAAKFSGGEVEVDGELYAQIGTVRNRATPVAFGRFNPSGSGTLLASSGNVTLTHTANGYRVFVVGEGDPNTWTVVATISYSDANTSVLYVPKPGQPLAVAGQPGNGVVYISSQCIAGCDEFVPPHYINFVIYKGHN